MMKSSCLYHGVAPQTARICGWPWTVAEALL